MSNAKNEYGRIVITLERGGFGLKTELPEYLSDNAKIKELVNAFITSVVALKNGSGFAKSEIAKDFRAYADQLDGMSTAEFAESFNVRDRACPRH